MKKSIFLIALLLLNSAWSQSIVAADALVSASVERLRSSAQAVIQQLDQTASINSFQIRQHLLVLISELEHSALTVETKTFKDLDKQQQELFKNIENAISEAQRAATASIDQAGLIAKNLESTVARLPLTDKSPRVLKIRPDHLLSPSGADSVRIVVEGNLLAYGPATLQMGGDKCNLASQTDTALAFMCPASTFKTSDTFKNVGGSLVVADYKEFWMKVRQVFRSYEPVKNYRSLVVAVPPKLGIYTLEVGYQVQSPLSKPASAPFESGNPHCTGEQSHSRNFSAQNGPGFTIVPGSVTFQENSGNQQRSMAGPLDFTPSGFRMQSTLRNGGICCPYIPLTSTHACFDARAWMGGTVSWLESTTVTTQKVENGQTGDVVWGSDIGLTLPDQLSYFKLTVSQIDGSKPLVIQRDDSQRWFKVERNEKILKISPRQLEQALKL